MSRLILALSTALTLTACTPAAIAPFTVGPAAVAQRTAADEQVAVGIELGYKAFRTAVELGVDTGVIKGTLAAKAAAADQRAYAAVQTARAAYKTANTGDFIAAAREANATIAAAIATVRSR